MTLRRIRNFLLTGEPLSTWAFQVYCIPRLIVPLRSILIVWMVYAHWSVFQILHCWTAVSFLEFSIFFYSSLNNERDIFLFLIWYSPYQVSFDVCVQIKGLILISFPVILRLCGFDSRAGRNFFICMSYLWFHAPIQREKNKFWCFF
jgi:hypothetical protein